MPAMPVLWYYKRHRMRRAAADRGGGPEAGIMKCISSCLTPATAEAPARGEVAPAGRDSCFRALRCHAVKQCGQPAAVQPQRILVLLVVAGNTHIERG